ncbi:SLBB domain-containing protein [Ekhidna sp. To15]|uniref:SLBB domain-containing protein n=1 Tax=Ekhidna sp. To15 TaxID=3395267 RepID=UPI003F525762
MKIVKYCLILLVIFCGSQSAAQDIDNLSVSDLNSVNIDELSDTQIQRFLDRAQESGLTLEQLEIVAQQRGMSVSQISKLRNRIRQLQLGSSDEGQIPSASDRLRERNDEETDEYSFFEFLNDADSINAGKLEIFGMDIFKTAEIAFEPSLNVATPQNYILGAGDEIIVDVYGASEITYQELISPDGTILISGLGPISLAGISVKEAKNRIFNRLSSIYSGLKGRNPNTFIQVSLGQVRSIKVNVVGNVVQPGTYELSSFSTAFNALYFAGGPTENGSLRQIEVFRGGQQIATLDVYKYLYEGEDDQNPQLQDQDVLIVKPYINRVKLAGNVKQPAIYELTENETVDYLFSFSGGFNNTAFKDFITIDRAGVVEREVSTINRSDFATERVMDGDSIYVTKILDTYANRVKLEGAVNRPGYYELTPDLTLSTLIEKANGLREDAYMKRGNVIRLSKRLSLKNISFDVQELINGKQDVTLSPDDIIRISSIFDLNEDQIITIDGQVRNPGVFPYIDSMTVEDIVGLSGGLKEDASASTIEVARRLTIDDDITKSSEIYTFEINRDLGINDEASDFLLQPFDLVLVKSTPFVRQHKVVKIEGEVNFPGYYALETNEDNISDLIKRAGGLTKYGYPKGSSLIRRTEYFRTEFEKEELQALLEARREELESKFINENPAGLENYDHIEDQLAKYEKELTEALKIEDSSNDLEARIFRAQELRKLLVRDSVSGADALIDRQAIGIELDKIIDQPDSNYDLTLKDGDLISVPRKFETVRVQGEVLYPNMVKFQQGASLKKYISASGGFSSKAKVGKSYVVYANGSAQRTKKFLFLKIYPQIRPGADIIVPQKEAKEKIDAREIIALTSAVGTMLLVIDRLSN